MNARLPVTALAFAILCQGASAQDDPKASVAACAAIGGDLERLSCFDTLAKTLGVDGPQAVPVQTAGTGKWQVRREKNPVDDTETVYLSLVAETGTSRFGDQVSFIARCQSNSTEAYIVWNDYLGSDYDGSGHRVTVRVGDAPAEEQRWSLSTDSKATFAPTWAGDLLKRMAAADKFLAQTTPYNESPVTATFDTKGMSNALQPLMEVCKWTMD